MGHQTDDAGALRKEIRELEGELFKCLGTHHAVRRWLNPDPELVRVWGRIKDNLGEIERLVESGSPTSRANAREDLLVLLRSRPRGSPWQLADAREFDHSLRVLLPYFADGTYLLAWLRGKKMRERFKKMYGADRLETWLKRDRLKEEEMQQLTEELAQLQLRRANSRRKDHTRHAIRSRELWRILVILLGLVLASGFALPSALDTSGWRVAVATAGGAVGSVLSGALKLPKLRRLTELRSFKAGLLLQPVVGAAAGLFAFLLVQTGVLHLPPSDTAPTIETFALYGFVAGYSEPFLLGLIRRLTGEPEGSDSSGSPSLNKQSDADQ